MLLVKVVASYYIAQPVCHMNSTEPLGTRLGPDMPFAMTYYVQSVVMQGKLYVGGCSGYIVVTIVT